jgi:uncharacterized protein (DUF2062 family)
MSAFSLIHKLRDFVVKNYHKLIQIHDTPHAIAGGVSIGIFVGFTPLFIPFVPLKSLLSFFISWLFRCSKTAAVIAVTAHDVIFPIWPFVLLWEYKIGFWLLHHHMPVKAHHRVDTSFQNWFSVETFHTWSDWVHERLTWVFMAKILGPTLIGSVVIGVPLAAIAYAIALRIVKRYQATLLNKNQTVS